MPTGIDVGPRAVHVATPDGVTQYGNEIRRANEAGNADNGEDEGGANDRGGDGGGDGDSGVRLEIETDDATYVLTRGTVAPDESLPRLFGPGNGLPASVRTAVAETFLEHVADPPDDGPLRYVAGDEGAEPLVAVTTGLEYDAGALDPGMAVCYDAFDAPATGLGVAVTEERAVATLAAAGVPVATTTVDLDGDWYDLGRTRDADGTGDDWVARQYETLLSELGADLAAAAPTLDDPVPVAVGGPAVPADGDTGRLDAALTAGLPFDVGSVTVADDPGACPARGALAAARVDDGTVSPLPAFAVDVPFVGVLADFGAATDAFGAAARARPTGDPADPADPAEAETDGREASADLEGAVARTRDDLATLDRRGAMTARGLSDVVDRLDDGTGADSERVAALRADLEEVSSRLPEDGTLESLEDDLTGDLDGLRESVAAVEADLDRLAETAATASAVADLESSLTSLDEAVSDLETDVESVRAVMTGLEDGEADVAGEALEDLAVDALQEDIEDLRSEVSIRVDDVWSAVGDLEGRVVDVEATAEDVPDLESTVASVRNGVADLEDQTAILRNSLDSLRSDLETGREESPSTDDLDAVEADLERLADDVDGLRSELRETEWVDPETVDQIETDLAGLRQTLISRADRLESLEETTEDLRERIETVYQNSAKSEALASLEAETARVRNTAGQAMERTNEMHETVSDLDETVADHAEQLGMLSTNVDNLAGSSVTRPEMQSSLGELEDRLDRLEAELREDLDGVRSLADQSDDVEPVEDEGPDLGVALQTTALVSIGLLGMGLAWYQSNPQLPDLVSYVLIFAFLLFVVVPAVLLGLVG
jgi:archaellum component FlaC